MSWLSWKTRNGRKSPVSPKRRPVPLWLEHLEDRLVPAGFDFSGQAPPEYPVGSNPSSSVAADVDGDGATDLITANNNNAAAAATVSVLRNRGDGTFEAQVTYPVGLNPQTVTAADLNGDGAPDLVTANRNNGNLSVLRNLGDGTFAAQVTYPVPVGSGGYTPLSVMTADVDRDGHMDLVATGQQTIHSNVVSVLRNRGDGTFAAFGYYTVGADPLSVAAADVDGDGAVDVITANALDSTVSVLRNLGGGTFAAQVTYAVGAGPRSVTTADLDGDGAAEVLTVNTAANTVSVLRNRGDGTFAAQLSYPVGAFPRSVATADLDGDGDRDLITANSSSGTVSVLRNLGGGTFAAAVTYAAWFPASLVTAADLDGDGDVDLATASSNSNNVSVMRNLGDGTFESPYLVGAGPSSVAAADLDGDGALDLLTANSTSNTVSVLRNLGGGMFAPQVSYAVGGGPFSGSGPSSVAAADLDGDGDLDLLTANSSSSNTVSVLRNRGDGTFAPQVTYAVGLVPTSVAAADVDGDGDRDLVVAHFNNSVSVLRNRGDGTFEAQVTYAVGSGPRSVAAADLDGDGDLDLVVASSSGNVSVLRNRGDGTFEPQISYVTGASPFSVTAKDLDRDGDLDLATANFSSGTVSVLLNLGGGTFAAHVTYPVGSAPLSVAAADLDGDGAADLVTANRSANSVSVLRNRGDGTFEPQVTYPVGLGPASVAVADLDGDGDGDLVTANGSASTLSVLQNRGEGTPVPLPDLTVTAVSALPNPAPLGGTLQLAYTVRNTGSTAARGRWIDSFFLSRDDSFDATDRFLTRVIHDGDLQSGASYDRTVDVSLQAFAGFASGEWFVVVRTDAGADVLETDNANNTRATPLTLEQRVTTLTLGQPVTGTVAAGQAAYFQVDYAEGQPLAFALTGLPTDGTVELYLRRDGLPSRTQFDRASAQPFAGEQYISLPPQVQGGTFYIAVYAPTLASSPASFELTAAADIFGVRTTRFGPGGNAGDFTLRALGSSFDRSITARLTNAQGFDLTAKAVYVESETDLYATFDLGGVSPGMYDVVFSNAAGVVVTVPQSMTLVAAAAPNALIPRIVAPSAIRRGGEFSFVVEWENSSLNDALAPLLTVGAPVPFGLDHNDYTLGTRYTFLGATTQGGPAGILRPGQRESITFWSYSNTEPGDYTVFVDRVIKDATEAFDWAGLRPSLVPVGVSDADFQPIFQQLASQVGPTSGDYLAMLSRNSALVSGGAREARSVSQLLSIEVNRAWAVVAPAIAGSIVDPPAGDLVGRQIVAENVATNEIHLGVVLADRTFVIPGLEAGEYRLSIPGYVLTHSLGDRIQVTAVGQATQVIVEVEQIDVLDRLRAAGADDESAQLVAAGFYLGLGESSGEGGGSLLATQSSPDPIVEAIQNNIVTPELIQMARDRLINLAALFKALDAPFASYHLVNFLSNGGSPINYAAGSYISTIARFNFTATFSHREAARLVEARVKSYIEDILKAGGSVPSPLSFADIGIGRPDGPNFYLPGLGGFIPPGPAPVLDLIAGFGDMSGNHTGQVSIQTTQAGDKIEYRATIRYEWKDNYTFGNDKGLSKWDNAAYYLEKIAGVASGFATSITIEERIEGVVDDPDSPDDDANVRRPVSFDPNDITGPASAGPLNHVAATDVMPYTIRFENDAQQAAAPAAMVVITQTLDPDLDWTTFRLGDIGFGDTIIDVPADAAFFQSRIDLTATRGVFVDVSAGINAATGEVRWEFVAIDPATGDLPENPLVGFLPPNVNGPEGEGFVTYTIHPNQTVATGDRVDAVASIVFDVNEPILTPAIFHTFDAAPGTSSVAPLPAVVTTTDVTVTWSGQDDAGGSGIAAYDAYVSDNGGPFTPWLAGTTATSAVFSAQSGHTYRFFSVATDNVGHVEATPTAAEAQATTTVDVNNAPFFTSTPAIVAVAGSPYSYTITSDDPDSGDTWTITALTLPSWLTLVDNGDGTATLRGTPTNARGGSHDISLFVTDAAGATATQEFAIRVDVLVVPVIPPVGPVVVSRLGLARHQRQELGALKLRQRSQLARLGAHMLAQRKEANVSQRDLRRHQRDELRSFQAHQRRERRLLHDHQRQERRERKILPPPTFTEFVLTSP